MQNHNPRDYSCTYQRQIKRWYVMHYGRRKPLFNASVQFLYRSVSMLKLLRLFAPRLSQVCSEILSHSSQDWKRRMLVLPNNHLMVSCKRNKTFVPFSALGHVGLLTASTIWTVLQLESVIIHFSWRRIVIYGNDL